MRNTWLSSITTWPGTQGSQGQWWLLTAAILVIAIMQLQQKPFFFTLILIGAQGSCPCYTVLVVVSLTWLVSQKVNILKEIQQTTVCQKENAIKILVNKALDAVFFLQGWQCSTESIPPLKSKLYTTAEINKSERQHAFLNIQQSKCCLIFF